MNWIQSSFGRAEGLYGRLFADWLHINFVVRTVLLLLMIWLMIFIGALIFKYAVGPLLLLAYINVILRAWNFLVVETVQEWIYIHHYSKGSPRFSSLYMQLTDRAKRNRKILSNNEQKAPLRQRRIRRLGNQMMITAGVIVAMWVVAFGINQEYTAPAWVAGANVNENNEPDENQQEPDETGANDETENHENIPGSHTPGLFPNGAQTLTLTQDAREGARLRSGPGTADTVVIEMLWGDELLTYLGYYIADADVDTLYWIRVRSQAGAEGYIGSHLVEAVG
ncbi:MAG: SH3 domain-containing protein [Defluviitaleaceae bacterium]|nr:SH3 domain-containing protein [Defluviitaleaceae bacterium]